MGHRLSGGEAVAAVVYLPAEQDAEAVDRPARLGEGFVERVEPTAMAVGERVEAGVQAREGLAVRGQDEQVAGELPELRDRCQPCALLRQ